MSADSKGPHGWPEVTHRGALPSTWDGHFDDPERDVFVGGLPYHFGDQALHELASKHGAILRTRVAFDKVTGNARGFGFVKCATHEDQANVIAALNGLPLGRQTLSARILAPRARGA
jgi:RNA recognition motif-containing protein